MVAYWVLSGTRAECMCDCFMFYFASDLPCDRRPSSSKACHIPAAWALVCTIGEKLSSQSTNSVPGAHLRIYLPDTCRARKEKKATIGILVALYIH